MWISKASLFCAAAFPPPGAIFITMEVTGSGRPLWCLWCPTPERARDLLAFIPFLGGVASFWVPRLAASAHRLLPFSETAWVDCNFNSSALLTRHGDLLHVPLEWRMHGEAAAAANCQRSPGWACWRGQRATCGKGANCTHKNATADSLSCCKLKLLPDIHEAHYAKVALWSPFCSCRAQKAFDMCRYFGG